MLLSLTIHEKTLGQKHLFEDLLLSIEEGEKVALIGRNGIGKSTLFHIISGEDEEYHGEIIRKKGARFTFTLQEHFTVGSISALQYILDHVPDYNRLHQIVSQEPPQDLHGIEAYTEAIQTLAELDYFGIEEKALKQLAAYQIDQERARAPLSRLSGGEKRYVELVKCMLADADLLCMDEPTNHMDYQGKEVFIEWLKSTRDGLLIISHDRDVLQQVDRIIEIKDRRAYSFSGNYSSYLKQNTQITSTQVGQYEDSLRKLEILNKRIGEATAKKASSPRAKLLEVRLMKEYDTLAEQVQKPSLWIDEDSVTQLKRSDKEKYDKYKDHSIRISHSHGHEYRQELVTVRKLSIGYNKPLFKNFNLTVYGGNRIQLQGRNGAGKTTLIRTLLAMHKQCKPETKVFEGEVSFDQKLRIGLYEQEMSPLYLNMTLAGALRKLYASHGRNLTTSEAGQVMGNYLFNPVQDGNLYMHQLSGGQRARFQIISMFANNPNLLILDEPTNHLDLPSIEELEKSLLTFPGAVLFVSHDSYFNAKMADEVVLLS